MIAFGVKAAFSASRISELTFALHAVAKANKVSKKEADNAVKSIRKQNISYEDALRVTSNFITANFKMTDAVKLATAAKDLAIGTDYGSSDALKTLTEAIVTNSTQTLSNFSIITTQSQAFEDYAESIGKSADELTAQEKQQAILNVVLREGKKRVGAYEAAQKSAGKQFRSLTTRIIPDFIVQIGKAFEPALAVVIENVTDAIKGMGEWLDDNKEMVKKWGETIKYWFEQAFKQITKVFRWIIDNRTLVENALIAIGIAASIVAIKMALAMAPAVAALIILTIAVTVFRNIWENNWGGIQEKTKAAIKFLKPFFSSLIESFGPLIDSLKKFWDAIQPILKLLAPLLGGVLVLALVGLIKYLEFTVKYWTNFLNISADVVDFITKKVVPAIERYGKKLINLNKDALTKYKEKVDDVVSFSIVKWDDFKKSFTKVVDWVSTKLDELSGAFGSFVDDLKKDFSGTLSKLGTDLVMFMLESITEITTGWSEGLNDMLDSFFDWSVKTVDAVDQWVTDVTVSIDNWITDSVVSIDNWITDTVVAMNDWGTRTLDSINDGLDSWLLSMSNFFTNLPAKFTEWLDNVWLNISTWWSSLGTKSLEATMKGFDTSRPNWILKIGGFILLVLALVLAFILVQLIDLGIKIISYVMEGINKKQTWFRDKVVEFIKGGFKLAGTLASSLLQIGKDIVTNIINGIKASPSALVNAIVGLLPSGALRTAFGKAMHIKGYAAGIRYFEGGAALVGEAGPEVVSLPRGSRITPNNQLAGMTFNINMSGIVATSRSEFRQLGKDFIEAVNEEVRAKGGKEIGK